MKTIQYNSLLVFILLLSLFFVPVSVYSQGNANNVNLFVEANRFYAEGNYETALNSYLKIVKSGIYSSGIFYNIGNSYFRLGETGYAILYYEKAGMLSPRDSDIQENLRYARNKILDRIDVKKGINLRELLVFPKYINLFESWVFFLFSYLLLWIFISLRLYLRGRVIDAFLVIASLIFVFSSAAFYSVYSDEKLNTKAVIIETETEVKSGNDLKSTTLFKLHEGSTVNVLSENGNWIKIELADGKKGWLPNADLRTVN